MKHDKQTQQTGELCMIHYKQTGQTGKFCMRQADKADMGALLLEKFVLFIVHI